jgi:hypothetical protein
MSVGSGEIRELLGEHEGIRTQMRFLARSQENLVIRDIRAKERIWAYLCSLHDFHDAIQFHIEVDERIFRALPVGVSLRDMEEKHETIKKLIGELIGLVDSDVVDRLGEVELDRYTKKIGLAFNKICDIVETHIMLENAMLEEALKKISTSVEY